MSPSPMTSGQSRAKLNQFKYTLVSPRESGSIDNN